MGKNKLKKFAEMAQMQCVFQCGARDILPNPRDPRGADVPSDNPALAMKGEWRNRFFHNDHPLLLELGCGHGDYTVGLARVYPDTNYIGVDIKGARMWQGAKQATAEGLTNVAFLRTNIELLPNFFASDEVDGLWITFPDPQMKKATKRLTSTYFMERYRQLLRDNATIHLKTDSPFLYTYTREMIRLNNLPLLFDTADLYGNQKSEISNQQSAIRNQKLEIGNQKSEIGNQKLEIRNQKLEIFEEDARRLQTHYEHQWLDRGLTIKYLVWQLPKQGTLVEPDIEIEKDTYRSYGRNYISQSGNS